MTGSKRKIENFDHNKSDSDDVDFSPNESRSRRTSKKARSAKKKTPSRPKKKHSRGYGGSDVSDDDIEDSESEESLGAIDDDGDEEEPEINEQTGRAVRAAAKKRTTYVEESGSDIADLIGEDEEEDKPKQTKRRASKRLRVDDDDEDADELVEDLAPPSKKAKMIVKLKVPTPKPTRRSTRGASTARSLRSNASVEPVPASTRRSTRAHSEAGDEQMALSNSGKHVIRASGSPEPIGRKGSKASISRKKPMVASTIKEEIHETSSYEDPEGQAETTMPTEVMGTDEDPVEKSDAPVEVPAEEADDEAIATTEKDDEPGVEAEAEPEPAPEPVRGDIDVDEDEEDVIAPITRKRSSRAGLVEQAVEEPDAMITAGGRRLRQRPSKNAKDQSSDFEPMDDASEEDISASDTGRQKSRSGDDTSPRRRGRNAGRASKSRSRKHTSDDGSEGDGELDPEEMADELYELEKERPKRRKRARDEAIIYTTKGRRERKKVDYSIKPLADVLREDEEGAEVAPTPSRRPRSGRNGASQIWERNLYTTYGPFGGGGGPAPVIGGPWGTGAIGGVDSDSSDDENMIRPGHGAGGNVGMTPTTHGPTLLPGLTQPNEAFAAMAGTPGANVGKIKSQKALADADPLGVDQSVDFSKVGGLQGHIDQLKEMVQMPLLYPELFQKFHVTPPRGVLFHGPPGTGKTLLARALAAQTSSNGQKITFYMRKGADALSKWVGEAERQLRLLFEEARKTQPSIIFFDEIDGLAPVRSSKQEQIHASIVSTLLALMDGMDGRGQVIVIGATNRPDNIDPALRRPGRFDREFYFPLPDIEGRKSILNIHTKDWGLDESFKESLAHVTKGYGGADLRALCTEAALNAMQRTYPQIYSSNQKLIVDPGKIKITAKDFMLSVKKMVPSSERSTSSGAVPLPKLVEPLLKDSLKELEAILDKLIPIKKKTTALEEAMYELDDDEDHGFGRETMQQEFEQSRVFRPRLLICGEPGQGQAYLGAALLNHFEGLHVQSFDLPTIYSDSARSPEAAIVQLFAEVKRRKPSVVFLPSIDTWYQTVPDNVITTFLGMLKSIPPTDPVLVLGICESPPDKVNKDMLRDLFGFSKKNRFAIVRPNLERRRTFFEPIIGYVRKRPDEFPEPANRKKRKLDVLEVAPPPPVKPPSKEEVKAQKKRDHQLLNLLKIQIQPVMDQIQKAYKKFRNPVIPQAHIQYLYDELDPTFVRADLPQDRPFELGQDKEGIKGLVDKVNNKFYYNLETTTIEERLSNGFYARPKDFLADIKSLAKDSRTAGDKERTLKANELVANAEVDLAMIEANPVFADCEGLYQRQLQRSKDREAKARKRAAEEVRFDDIVRSDLPTETQETGPLGLGEPIPGNRLHDLTTPSGAAGSNGLSNGSDHRQSNGEDVQMGGTDEANTQKTSQANSMHHPYASGRSNVTGGTTQVSQHSAFQELPPGVSPKDMINDASTTTSGDKKTSQGWSTQATNGIHSSPPVLPRPNSQSQVLDTQDALNTQPSSSQVPSSQPESQRSSGERKEHSSEEWAHSQAHALSRGVLHQQPYGSQTPSSGSQSQPPVPAFNAPATAPPKMPRGILKDPSTTHPNSLNTTTAQAAGQAASNPPSGLANILNSPLTSPVPDTAHQAYLSTQVFIDNLSRHMTEATSGMSVEQLEQVYREMMVRVWETKGDWNRDWVSNQLIECMDDCVRDIEGMQRVQSASQNSGEPGTQESQGQGQGQSLGVGLLRSPGWRQRSHGLEAVFGYDRVEEEQL